MDSYQPNFKITANDKDITSMIAARFASLTLTDETGTDSDALEITLADTDPANPVKIPPTGAELRLFLWYGDEAPVDKGLFICDEIELQGWPATLTIRARAAPYDGTPKGKVDFQTQKSRSWPVVTTIGAMVSKMAAEHGMTGITSPELAGEPLPHIDQSAESDINLLVRLARRYDAIAKPAGGKLIFAKRGNAKTVRGADLPKITLKPGDVGTYRMTLAQRDSAGTVLAFYRNVRAATRHQVTAGSGEPVRRLRSGFKDKAMATAAVKAELASRARGQSRLSLQMPGRPGLTAESSLDLQEFRQGIAGDWLVTRVEHAISSSGYVCWLQAEKPNGDKAVQALIGGQLTDSIRP